MLLQSTKRHQCEGFQNVCSWPGADIDDQWMDDATSTQCLPLGFFER